MAFIRKKLILRSIASALLAIILLVPPGLAVAALTGLLPLTKVGFFIFNLMFGALVGLRAPAAQAGREGSGHRR